MTEAAQIVDAVVSALPHIEPMVGAAFAVNLAYLNLDRFRYRENIRTAAGNHYKKLKKAEHFDAVGHQSHVLMLRDLAGLKDHDLLGNDEDDDAIADGPKRKSRTFAEKSYHFLFEHHFDLWASRIGTGICLILLYLGVAHSVEIHTSSAWVFSGPAWTHFWFYAISAFLVLPIIFVMVGNWIVRHLKAETRAAYSEIAKTLDNFAATAKLSGDPKDAVGEDS